MKFKKIELVIFHPYSMIGGADKSLSRLINNIDHNKYKITFLTLNKLHIKKYLKKNINIIKLNKTRTFLTIFKTREILKKIIQKNNKVLFISNQNFANIISFFITYKINKIKHIIIERNHIDELNYSSGLIDFLKKNLIKFLMKILFKKADCIIGNCKKLSEDLSKFVGAKVKTIYNPAFDKEIYPLSKKKIKFTSRGKIILNIGRLEKQKDQLTIIKAIEKIKNIRLVIIGYGSLKKSLINYIDKNNLKKKVIILENITNPYPFLKISKLFVLSSLYEGFPNVLAEAIMLNVPIISSNCNSGPQEILLQKNGNQIFEKGNSKELNKKIINFLSNPKKILNRRNILYKKLKRFDKKKIIKQYDKLFTELTH